MISIGDLQHFSVNQIIKINFLLLIMVAFFSLHFQTNTYWYPIVWIISPNTSCFINKFNSIWMIFFPFWLIKVGTPPPWWHVTHTSWWHVARILIRITQSGSPQEYMWRASPIRTSSGRSTQHLQISHLDDRHITSGRPTYPIRICLYESLTEVSKSYTSS